MFLGLGWWLLTGDPVPSLPLAVFFELFWLDLIPSGGYLPPMAAFPYLLLLGLCATFGWQEAGFLVVPLALSLPLAYVVPFYESRLRRRDSLASQRLVRSLEGLEEHGKQDDRQERRGEGRLARNEAAERENATAREERTGMEEPKTGRLIFMSSLRFLGLGLAAFGILYGLCLVLSLSLFRQHAAAIHIPVGWPILYAVAAMGALLSLRIRKVYLTFALCMAVLLFVKIA